MNKTQKKASDTRPKHLFVADDGDRRPAVSSARATSGGVARGFVEAAQRAARVVAPARGELEPAARHVSDGDAVEGTHLAVTAPVDLSGLDRTGGGEAADPAPLPNDRCPDIITLPSRSPDLRQPWTSGS